MHRLLLISMLGLAAACSGSSTTEDPQAGGNGNSSSSSGGSPGASPGSRDGGRGSSGEDGAETRAGCKRGVAYGYHSEADLRALSKGVSWWYNWAFEPDTKVRNVYASIGVEYVPMVWGANVDTAQVQSKAPAASFTLLGFNEPNFDSQANMSAKTAAEKWPSVQAVADARAMRLVSPAVNFCGGGCQNTDPFAYLEEFLGACSGCRVDALGIHLYVGCKGDGKNHAQWLINHVETYKRRFTQPLWLTEFACDDAATPEDQRAFMIDAVTYLENEPRIERYAWFAGRADNVPNVDLLGADGQLTTLGKTYVDLPRTSACRP